MYPDPHLQAALEQVEKAIRGQTRAPVVRTFFDEPTFTATHVVHDPVIIRRGRHSRG